MLSLAACGQPAEESAPAPVEQVAVAPAPSTAPVGPLSEADLRRVCRAGLAAIHGQTPADIEITGLADRVVSARWRAPVDGGWMKAQCRVEGDRIDWMPLDLPDAAHVRWMNREGDPVNTFADTGDRIVVTQTLPDGAAEQAVLTVPAAQEAG